MTKENSQRGFTLIEVMMMMILFPLVFLSGYAVSDTARAIFNTNTLYSEMNKSAAQMLRTVNREIGQTSPLTTPSHLTITPDGNGNSIVTFQIPVDHDGDGDVVTGALNPVTEWGAYDSLGDLTAGRLNGWARYSVNGNNQLVRDVLDNALNPLPQFSQIILNNVTTFTAVRAGNDLTTTLVVTQTDQEGQAGQTRDFTATFTDQTMLRNEVN